jgi:hypothetical protein
MMRTLSSVIELVQGIAGKTGKEGLLKAGGAIDGRKILRIRILLPDVSLLLATLLLVAVRPPNIDRGFDCVTHNSSTLASQRAKSDFKLKAGGHLPHCFDPAC